MYDDNENKIAWGSIIKKIIIVIVAILVILALISMVTKCTKNDDNKKGNNTTTTEKVDLSKQLDELEKATLKYFNKDNLPTSINASKTIRLKIFKNNGLITDLVDSAGNKCDASESYSEVTRLDNNYAAKISVTCGNNKDYRIIYFGCFQECNGEVCKGTEGSTNGICEITPTEEPKDENSNTGTQTGNNGSTTKPSTPNKKPSKPNNGGSTSNNGSGNNGGSTVKPIPPKYVTTYEYAKYSQSYGCKYGTLNRNNQCERRTETTLYGKVIKLGGKTTYKTVGQATPVKNETTVYFKNTSLAKNTSTVKYTFIKYDTNKGYVYKKVTTSYRCSKGTVSGTSCVVAETSPVTYSCADKSYTYNKSSNVCTKVGYNTEYYNPIITTYLSATTWSKSPTLAGWVRTGKTGTALE